MFASRNRVFASGHTGGTYLLLTLIVGLGCRDRKEQIDKVKETPSPSSTSSSAPEPAPKKKDRKAIPTDCPPTMAGHPGGKFEMCTIGCTNRDEVPAVKVEVMPFCLDKLEVTVADYEPCWKAGVCTEPPDYRENPQPAAPYEHRTLNWKHPDPARRKHPVNGVSWEQATAFCAWKGWRLPTEIEFEWASRGGENAYDYPWGETEPDGTQANVGDASFLRICGTINCFEFWKPTFDDGHGFTAPVGSYPKGANPWGVLDLVGNVDEWTSSIQSFEGGEQASWVRGGNWRFGPRLGKWKSYQKYGHPIRTSVTKGMIDGGNGFRCARDG